MNINTVLNTNEYNFVKDIPNIMFLTFGGSIAYGTNIPTSDIDIRGCAANPASEILLGNDFEQYINIETDTTIYSFNKLMSLLKNCNPNTIEMLGGKPEFYTQVSSAGQKLIDNRKIFLSKQAYNSFSGYAYAQLTRLKNALSRNSDSELQKTKKMQESCMSAIKNINNKYKALGESSVLVNVDKVDDHYELFLDANIKNYPLNDYAGLISDLQNIVKTFGQLNKRNKKKDDMHLCKHAMHLLRLYLMCIDIFEKEDIITYRENDHELLMNIRNGKYQLSPFEFDPAFFELIETYKARMEYAYHNTSLPEKPDYGLIDELQYEINKNVILNS